MCVWGEGRRKGDGGKEMGELLGQPGTDKIYRHCHGFGGQEDKDKGKIKRKKACK